MGWDTVGKWLKGNAGTGAALVGSLLTGNVPGAVAAGISLVGSATGTDDPVKALEALQTDPMTVVRLKELAYENEADIRNQIRTLKEMELTDAQSQQHETQETIRSGDRSDSLIVRVTRPLQSWASLGAAIYYGVEVPNPDVMILFAFMVLPLTYMGVRMVDKNLMEFVSIGRDPGKLLKR